MQTDEKSNRSSGSSAEQESTQEDQMAEQESVQLSDFSFHQIRDRLSFGEFLFFFFDKFRKMTLIII